MLLQKLLITLSLIPLQLSAIELMKDCLYYSEERPLQYPQRFCVRRRNVRSYLINKQL